MYTFKSFYNFPPFFKKNLLLRVAFSEELSKSLFFKTKVSYNYNKVLFLIL